jgi:hypothetical protein
LVGGVGLLRQAPLSHTPPQENFSTAWGLVHIIVFWSQSLLQMTSVSPSHVGGTCGHRVMSHPIEGVPLLVPPPWPLP